MKRVILLTLWMMGPLAAPALANPRPFHCCNNPAVESVLESYVELQSALSASNKGKKATTTSLAALRSTLAAAQKDEDVTEEDRLVIASAITVVDELGTSAPPRDIRRRFDEISRTMVFLALNHLAGERRQKEEYVEGVCPKGPWIQKSGPLEPPYARTDGCDWR